MKYNKSMAQVLAEMNKVKKEQEDGGAEDPIDVAKKQIQKIKKVAVLKKQMADIQKSEDTDLEEKVEYIEYKFRNSKQAVDAVRFVQAMNTGVPRNLDINSDQENKGIIVFDAGRDDFTKIHKMIVKKFRPQILAVEKLEKDVSGEEVDEAALPKNKQSSVLKVVKKKIPKAYFFGKQLVVPKGELNKAKELIKKANLGYGGPHGMDGSLITQEQMEQVENLEEFTDKQIERLRKEYEDLRGKETGINPEKFKKLRGMMKRFPKANLLKLVKADIPVLTTGAKAALVMYHGMKWKQLPEDFLPYVELFADDNQELSEVKKGKFKEVDPKVIDRIEKMMRGNRQEKDSIANMLNYFMPPEVVDMVRYKLKITQKRGRIKF